MKDAKVVKSFVYRGLGVPVELRNATLTRFREAWTPQVKLNWLGERVFEALASKPAPLTGDEVRFIRQHMRATLEAFARRLRVTHQAVMKWEGAGDGPTGMGWGTEIALRLAVLDAAGAASRKFQARYRALDALELADLDARLVHDPDDPALADVGYPEATRPAPGAGRGVNEHRRGSSPRSRASSRPGR